MQKRRQENVPVASLTPDQLGHLAERYTKDGFVLIEELLSPEELDEVRRNIDRYNTHIVPNLPESVSGKTVRWEPDGTTIRSCYFMDQVDEWFRGFANQERFKRLVASVVGYEPQVYCVETFNKQPRVGTPAVLHQDAAYFQIEPRDMAHLWIAIDDADESNGALRYWVGSHREGLLPHKPAIRGYLAVDVEHVRPISDEIVHGVLRAGGAAIHSGLSVHDSPANPSAKPRMALLCGYRGTHTKFIGLGKDENGEAA
jgi:phytanoyl-CoA hydroxylase